MDIGRRGFLGAAAAAAAGCAVRPLAVGVGDKPEYHVFSRVFQFIRDYDRAADVIRRCGYDGVEWTVRPKGFIEPSCAARDLAKAKCAAEKAGLKAESIVVSFLRGDDPGAEDIVRAAADAGYKSFRGAYFTYDPAITMRQNYEPYLPSTAKKNEDMPNETTQDERQQAANILDSLLKF